MSPLESAVTLCLESKKAGGYTGGGNPAKYGKLCLESKKAGGYTPPLTVIVIVVLCLESKKAGGYTTDADCVHDHALP